MDTSSHLSRRSRLGLRTGLFGLSVLLVLVGAAVHLREFAAARDDGYRLAGMPFDGEMSFAMALIAAGVVLASYVLLAPVRRPPGDVAPLELRLVEDARLGAAHWMLLAALTIALAIDVMKPATLGFVIPGMRHEYGLSKAHVSVLPLVALTGTAVGSLLWGIVADRCGRRATVLFGAVMFMGTSVCGAMPSFSWNVA